MAGVELTIRDDADATWPEGWFETVEGSIQDSSFERAPQPESNATVRPGASLLVGGCKSSARSPRLHANRNSETADECVRSIRLFELRDDSLQRAFNSI